MKPKKKSAFDAQTFLESIGALRRVAEFRRKQIIFSQGEAADAGAKEQIGVDDPILALVLSTRDNRNRLT